MIPSPSIKNFPSVVPSPSVMFPPPIICSSSMISSPSPSMIYSSKNYVGACSTIENKSSGIYEVYTDGSYLGCIQRAGWAYVVIKCKLSCNLVIKHKSGSVEGTQTNNRGELMAILRALQDVNTFDYTIYTDSQYSKNCVTKWYINWEKNGWRTTTGTSVKNADLIAPIVQLLKIRPNIRIEHIKAHSGHKFNEMADRLAKAAASASD
jgi:ribonuclease HI